MARRFLHVVLMPEDGGSVRNFRITSRTLHGILVGLVFLVAALAASILFHVRTFRDASQMSSLRAENHALRVQFDEFGDTTARLEEAIREAERRERDARLLAGLDPVDDETRRLGIGGPQLSIAPPGEIRSGTLREGLQEQSRRLDAMERQLEFQHRSYTEVLTTLQSQKERLARTPTISPVRSGYTLSSGFGPRLDPFTGRSGWHNGLDFRAAPGTAVLATADGTVSFVGFNGDFGLTVQIDHGGGIETSYCHLSSATVRPGQAVRRGAKIGGVGNSGRSTGSHLHYEVWNAGRPSDPTRYILTPQAIVD